MHTPSETVVEFRHFHLFAGLGGGARGFNRGEARVGNLRARFRCIGGVDVDPAAVRDFERLSGARGTVLDLFDREQYRAFHGHEPPPDWREATPADIRRAAGGERPAALVTSPPCKGFSGLLSESKSRTAKYQALNRLTLRGMWLMLEAWADDPPELVLLENVPRAISRGRELIDRITAMLRAYGYATAETTHDCGELGGLAQSRKRFLLVARHIEKVPGLLYEPPTRPLRAVGDVLGKLPLAGHPAGGVMHRVPRLAWATWVRLAFIPAGGDWRSLERLAVADGVLRDYLIVPAMFRGGLGVRAWDQPTGAVPGRSLPFNGAYNVADPRFGASSLWNDGQAFGVRAWGAPTGTVAGQQSPGQGAYSVADPRPAGAAFGKYAITRWEDAAGTIIAGSTTGQGAFAVADPRSGLHADRQCYRTAGHYGVTAWSDTCGAVSAAAGHDNGRWNVADPRLPATGDHLLAVIEALDGTWHRPFTTLELAALQSLFDPEDPQDLAAWGLDGTSDSAWRERIGNAIPCASAQAIANEMGRTLLLAYAGETFQLSAAPVWVRPTLAALHLARGAEPGGA